MRSQECPALLEKYLYEIYERLLGAVAIGLKGVRHTQGMTMSTAIISLSGMLSATYFD